jgi:glucan phosphoethanolaminetransferase (alkaline phosphatase superfamily)
MQYKIPVQIENEDPILLWLSIRQLFIILFWWFVSYNIFQSVAKSVWAWIAIIPAVLVFAITLVIALFKYYEMTFLPFIVAWLRYLINTRERIWKNGIDSFQPIEIGYIVTSKKKDTKIEVEDKKEKLKKVEESLNKI